MKRKNFIFGSTHSKKLNDMKLKVKPEGRENIFLVSKGDITDWLKSKKLKHIHNYIPSSLMVLGADHEIKSVLEDIKTAERIAILIGEAQSNNLGHALAIIRNNKLYMFDIGKITLRDLKISE